VTVTMIGPKQFDCRSVPILDEDLLTWISTALDVKVPSTCVI